VKHLVLKSVVAIFVGLLIFTFVFLIKGRWCPIERKGGVFYGSVEFTDSPVFNDSHGNLIVILENNHREGGIYLLSVNDQSASFLSRGDFVRTPFGLYSHYFPYHGLIISTTNVKTGIDPHLYIDSTEIRFKSSEDGKEIRVLR
jgi:hypothetical protein